MKGQGDNTTKYDTQPFYIISCSFHHFPYQHIFFLQYFWVFLLNMRQLAFLHESKTWSAISVCQLGSSTQLFSLGCESRRGNSELGCFQCDFNSSSLSLAARMYFIQQWLLMQSLLIFWSRYILAIKHQLFSTYECSCDCFSSLYSAFPFLKRD